MLYEILRALHNLLRWFVLAGMGWALFVVYRDLFAGAVWADRDKRAGVIFTGLLGLQFIVGLVLYFISPFNAFAAGDMSAVASNPVLRFFGLEHPMLMLVAFVIAQVGYGISKRSASNKAKFWWAAGAYTVAALIILGAIPWPGMEAGRPLLPWFS